MWWIAWWLAVTTVGTIGTIAATNSLRFAHRIGREVQELFASSSASAAPTGQRMDRVPPPVRRYLTKVLGARSVAIRTVQTPPWRLIPTVAERRLAANRG